jgi:hypothetical protein
MLERSYSVKPEALIRIVYRPAGRPVSRYVPSSAARALAGPINVLPVAVTVAPETAAPVWSEILPYSCPVVSCENPVAAQKNTTIADSPACARRRSTAYPPPESVWIYYHDNHDEANAKR